MFILSHLKQKIKSDANNNSHMSAAKGPGEPPATEDATLDDEHTCMLDTPGDDEPSSSSSSLEDDDEDDEEEEDSEHAYQYLSAEGGAPWLSCLSLSNTPASTSTYHPPSETELPPGAMYTISKQHMGPQNQATALDTVMEITQQVLNSTLSVPTWSILFHPVYHASHTRLLASLLIQYTPPSLTPESGFEKMK